MSRTQLLLCLFGISAAFFNHVEADLKGEGIIGGELSDVDQFPYQISLELVGNSICGGSILSERFVITAAHCVIDDDNSFMGYPLKVVAGITRLKSNPKSRVATDVVRVYVPKDYHADVEEEEEEEDKRSVADIAILELAKDLDFEGNSKLGKVKLPEKDETYAGKKANISGFGLNHVDVAIDLWTNEIMEVNGESDGKMRYAEANVLSYEDCQDIYSPVSPIEKTHLCAALVQHNPKEPEGVCSGDSGGPLVYEGVQIGVVSSSPLGCREKKVPAVYTRVSDYLDFINKVLKGDIDDSIRTTKLRILPGRFG